MPVVQSTNAQGPTQNVAAPIARLDGATVILDDRPVLRHVDVEIGPGITVLRGPNGAGKTTALRALAGLVPLARGTREVPGDVLYIGHRPQLLHGLTARENLHFFADFRRSGREELIDRALDRWGVTAVADRPVERLSAGQRRRTALARIDAEQCALALLDEPFAELDEEAAALLRASLADAGSRHSAVLVASHGHAELDDLARRVYVLREGEVVSPR